MWKKIDAVLPMSYREQIYGRSFFRYHIGLCFRFIIYLKYLIIRKAARHNGAIIGKDTIISWNLAKKANKNLVIGNSSIIAKTASLDLRSKIVIGNNVIINRGVTILRASHDVDDPYFSTTFNDLIIEDYVWLSTGCVIIPRVSMIGEGAIIGAYSVLTTKKVAPMFIMAGNPARMIKERKQTHFKLVTESMQSGDLKQYRRNRRYFRKQEKL